MPRSEITVKKFGAYGDTLADYTSPVDYRDALDRTNDHVFTHPGHGRDVLLGCINGSGNNITVLVTAPAQVGTLGATRPLTVTIADGKTGFLTIPSMYCQSDGTVQVDITASADTSSYLYAFEIAPTPGF